MSIEIEKRFKEFNYFEAKDVLVNNGFIHVGSYHFKVIMYKGKPNQLIRVRDEGHRMTNGTSSSHRITFTIKYKNSDSFDTEYEVLVNDYDMINLMLNQLNIVKDYELHKYREIYQNGIDEVIFDHMPGLPPYMEIESKTVDDLESLMNLLNVKTEVKFYAKDLYYENYGITKDRPNNTITFQNIESEMELLITKNRDDFKSILKTQLEEFKLI